MLNNSWVNKSGEELFTQIRATMPAETPGSLSDDEYYDVTAFILASANIAIDGGMISHAAINSLSIQPGEAAPATSAADSTAWTHYNGDVQRPERLPSQRLPPQRHGGIRLTRRGERRHSHRQTPRRDFRV